MQRIDTVGKAVDLFGPGKHGFRDGDPVAGIAATRLDAAFFNAVQEEIAGAIEGSGAAVDPANSHQLLAAIQALIAAAVAQSALSAGTIATFPAASPPAGWLEVNGAIISRETYADLWTYAQASGNLVSDADWSSQQRYGSFSMGDEATTFRIPDLRGYFIRGYDNGRGVDSGRTLGSQQLDALQNITGSFGELKPTGSSTSATTGAFGTVGAPSAGSSDDVGSGARSFDFDASRVARTSTETRPRNVAQLCCIKY